MYREPNPVLFLRFGYEQYTGFCALPQEPLDMGVKDITKVPNYGVASEHTVDLSFLSAV